jgi:hypothetical protein
MVTMTKKSTLTELVAEVNKSARTKIAGPVVDKKGKATPATLAMLSPEKPARSRKSKIVVVEAPAKKKYPVQIRHIRAEVQPAGKYELNGTDTVTDCGRIVVKQMTRKSADNMTGKTVVACPHCLQGGHRDKAFQIVRGAVKLLPIEA